MTTELPMRMAVRGLVIDRLDRVLMVKMQPAHADWIGWILPGGGIEPGEDHAAALRRELHEETGLVDAFIGPLVCQRRQISPDIVPGYSGQEESIYLVPCRDFTLAPALSPEELRAEGIVDMDWLTVADMVASDEQTVPRQLTTLVQRVLEFGGSVEPLIIEED